MLLLVLMDNSCTSSNSSNQMNDLEINNKGKDEINYSDTSYFKLSIDYLHKHGKREEVNASSVVGKEMMVTYYFNVIDGFKLSSDHSNRIYVSQDNQSFGNILFEYGEIQVEVNYGVPDPNPKESALKKEKIWEIYKRLVDLALR